MTSNGSVDKSRNETHNGARNSEWVLTATPPKADLRIAYGSGPQQFADLRLPKKKAPEGGHPLVMFIHGGYWRAKYTLDHAGHLCAALAEHGYATWNTEYRRVGDAGGGWPGSFEDLTNSFRYLEQTAKSLSCDPGHIIAMGHSAGGQLALALAAHQQKTIHRAVSLAGVLDLERAWELHLSNDAVVEFMGGTPQQVADHYREASPIALAMKSVRQNIVHGRRDKEVPFEFSERYVARKKKQNEDVRLVALAEAGHFELIDPLSAAFPRVLEALEFEAEK